jgi:NifU-like protein involved in Fe-S cluster formation
MDEAIIKYYRGLMRTGFEHAGKIDNPTIFLDAVSEGVPICDHIGQDSLQLFIRIEEGIIDAIKYLCVCDPATNVAVEILCILMEGKTLAEVKSITEDSFSRILGSDSEDLSKKAKGLIALVNRGLR